MTDPLAALDTARQAVAAALADRDSQIAELKRQLDQVQPAPPTTLWGSSVWTFPGETITQAAARVEQQLKPQVIRHFCTGAPAWPSWTDHPLVISFKLPPTAVIGGQHDAELSAFFAATQRPSFWTYWHEPEDEIKKGQFTAADYRSAWARIAGIAKQSGKPLTATLILMGWTLQPQSNRNWRDYYPGDDVIDVLAWDVYLWDQDWTPQRSYDAARTVSQQAGKPWAVAETGVGVVQHPDPGTRQAKLTAAAHYLATCSPRPMFVTYFDSDPSGDKYGWSISRDSAASAAWLAGQQA